MFVQGGYKTALSKVLGEVIHTAAGFVGMQLAEPNEREGSWRKIVQMDVVLDPTVLDFSTVTKFTGDTSVPGPRSILAVIEQHAAIIDSKRDELSCALAVKSAWGGCQGKVALATSGISANMVAAGTYDLALPGAEFWLSLLKINVWRFSPSAVPLPGIATFVTPAENNTLYILVIQVESVLKEGVSIKDLKSFMNDSEQGLEVLMGSPLWET